MFIISLQLLHIRGSKVQVLQKKSSIVFKMFVEYFFWKYIRQSRRVLNSLVKISLTRFSPSKTIWTIHQVWIQGIKVVCSPTSCVPYPLNPLHYNLSLAIDLTPDCVRFSSRVIFLFHKYPCFGWKFCTSLLICTYLSEFSKKLKFILDF
jgi:hypothetical protein